MLPRETSLRQLKMLRKLTKGTDIGDLTSGDRMNHNLPNLQYIGNPVDTEIDSYEDFTEKDSKLQTIAFKSKLVNKSIKENNNKIMENTIINFDDFDNIKEELETEDDLDLQYIEDKQEENKIKKFTEDEDEDDEVQPVEDKALESKISESKEPEYTMLGAEKEPKSNPNFGYAAVRDQETKKIANFNNWSPIDPPTPKERSIGGSSGQYIDNGKVKGFVNRIDGKDVYVESVDEPMTIKKFSIKDVVKTKKEK